MTTPTQPLIAVDVVPVAYSAVDGLLVGTSVRQFAPSAGKAALPGVLLGAGEQLHDAAHRALFAKGGVDGLAVRHLAQLGAFDSPGRDPRSAAISIAFIAVVAPGSGDRTDWLPFDQLSELPFDHSAIAKTALCHLRAHLWSDERLTRALTGKHFTSVDAADITGAVSGTRPHAGNLHRTLSHDARVERTTELEDPRAAGRPPSTWKWGN